MVAQVTVSVGDVTETRIEAHVFPTRQEVFRSTSSRRSNNCWKSTSDQCWLDAGRCTYLRPEVSSATVAVLSSSAWTTAGAGAGHPAESGMAACCQNTCETYRIRNCPGQEKLKSICFSVTWVLGMKETDAAGSFCHSWLSVCSCVYVTRQRFLWASLFKEQAFHSRMMATMTCICSCSCKYSGEGRTAILNYSQGWNLEIKKTGSYLMLQVPAHVPW